MKSCRTVPGVVGRRKAQGSLEQYQRLGEEPLIKGIVVVNVFVRIKGTAGILKSKSLGKCPLKAGHKDN